MKRVIILSVVVAVALQGNGQGLKKTPVTRTEPIITSPIRILPNNERPVSAMPVDPKRPTDRQVDSVYKNVYHMEVPVFYESGHTIYMAPKRPAR